MLMLPYVVERADVTADDDIMMTQGQCMTTRVFSHNRDVVCVCVLMLQLSHYSTATASQLHCF
jgi:hypothetical protein